MVSWGGSRPQHTVGRMSFCPSNRGVNEMPIHWESASSLTFMSPVVSSLGLFICSWDKALPKSALMCSWPLVLTFLVDSWQFQIRVISPIKNMKTSSLISCGTDEELIENSSLLIKFAKQLLTVCLTNANNYSDRNLE